MIDVLVVGGGHAGIEAAIASSKRGKNTVLVTGDLSRVGFMSCNPSIGGPAKGIVVREIDALGGLMAKVSDKTQIQIKMLNRSKGPAVWALRAQIDKVEYPKEMLKELKQQENLTLLEKMVEGLIIEDDVCKGVYLKNNEPLYAKTVIITTGTYLASKILMGDEILNKGPDNQPTTYGISGDLEKHGFRLIRLKTGTPARVKKESIDFSKTTPQYGDEEQLTFSIFPKEIYNNPKVECYLTHTNLKTHQIINSNLTKSAMFSGAVEGVGPRYCPSIEDKVVRFSAHPRHQVFLEPETLSNDEFYLQGLSTSFPKEIQDQMIRTVPGLENVEIVRYGYAIEYDAVDPTQLKQSLETQTIENLFCAGQINGTSGYEEAAAQGLMAGINASLKVEDKEPFILKRSEAYIGLLIDDLVSKGTDEPYRLLTSRAEHRLLLRNDNVDLRLMDYGYDLGLIDQKTYDLFLNKKRQMEEVEEKLNQFELFPNKKTNDLLQSLNFSTINQKTTLLNLLKRPDLNYNVVKPFIKGDYSDEVLENVEIHIKYKGYIEKAFREATKLERVDNKLIPEHINYDLIKNIAVEARDKLKKHKPKTVGQASRISGVNPSDISVLLIYLKTLRWKHYLNNSILI